ncbi:hypothetical protein D9757_007124 [Collybiopsis confluens]|uniref:Zn(2)-C6 fungal-type domain-containing protein n=1 Tax=Collybiopsis confluens TaxID=2823264 RepID=A0A8H5HCT3_9AGAR|nr:hypothetical protein D9757_007124 [Collybiopsis confluens]
MDSNANRKKSRLQNSCDSCRKKKIRCDSATMPNNICSVCMNMGVECRHTNTPKKRGPKPNHTAQAAIVHAVLAEPLTYQIPEDTNTTREMLVDISLYARSLEKDISRLRRTMSVSSDIKPSTPLQPGPESAEASTSDLINPNSPIDDFDEDDDDIDTNTISENFKRLSLYQSRPIHYAELGMSSEYVLTQTLFEVDFEHKDDIGPLLKRFERPLFWAINPWQRELPFPMPQPPLVFPEDDLLHDLISIYFADFDPYLPLLHRKTFEQAIKDGLHLGSRVFGKVVLAVCALASRHLPDARNMIAGTANPELTLGWPYFKQIGVLQTTSFIDPPQLYDLQLFALSVVFLQGTSTSEYSWILIGTAIRIGQAIGIHRRGRSGQPRTIERELWNRAFWALINIDISFSMFLGRPRATTVDDFDLELPIDCDQEHWEGSEENESFAQPAGKPSLSSFWIHYIRLLQIAAATHRLIYPIKKLDVWRRMGITGRAWHQRAVMEIDSLLNQWVDHIPEHVKWDPNRKDPVSKQQSVILYTTYYWVQVQVHKAFIPRPGQQSILTFPSLAICANAARSCIQAAELQSPKVPILPIYVLTQVFSCGIIILLNFWRAKHSPDAEVDFDREMVIVRKCFDILTNFSQRFQNAGRFMDILNAIISLGKLGPEYHPEASKPTPPSSEEACQTYSQPPTDHPNVPAPLSPTNHVPYTDPNLPFHTYELGGMPLYSSNALYDDLSASSQPVQESSAQWPVPDLGHVNDGSRTTGDGLSTSGEGPYDPNVIEYYTQYGMQGVIASVESYTSTAYVPNGQTSQAAQYYANHARSESQNQHLAPQNQWHSNVQGVWERGPGSGSRVVPPYSNRQALSFIAFLSIWSDIDALSGLGEDWSVFLSNVDELLHSAAGEYPTQPS